MSKIAQFNPDIVLTAVLENFGTAAWLAANRLRIPVVNVIHGYNLQCIPASRFRNSRHCRTRCLQCRLGTAGKKYFSKSVDGVIGVSRYVLDVYRSEGYFPNAREICIYNPVEQFAEHSRQTPTSQPPVFGYLGKLHEIKGIEPLIREFSTGKLKVRLLVAGDGEREYEARMRQLADPAFVEFMGWLDPMELFKRIDFLIYPSVLHEPFGRGIIEAMSQGIPVLGARRGGIPEVIDHGRNGFLYNPAIAGELAQAIELAQAARYSTLSENALQTSRSFSKTIIANQYLNFLNAIVDERRRAPNFALANHEASLG
jgi:glycosyltransferase involved in cell wall biosynthesis